MNLDEMLESQRLEYQLLAQKAQKEIEYSRNLATARDAWRKGQWTDAQGVLAWKLGEVRDPEYWRWSHRQWVPATQTNKHEEKPLTDEEILGRVKAEQERKDQAEKELAKAVKREAKETRRKAKAEARRERMVEWASMAVLGMIAFLTLNSMAYVFLGVHLFNPETSHRAAVLVVAHAMACVAAMIFMAALVAGRFTRSS